MHSTTTQEDKMNPLRKMIAPPAPATPREALKRGLVRALSIFAPFAVAFLVGTFLFPSALMTWNDLPSKPPVPSVSPEKEPSRADRLIERHGCWTGEPPAKYAGVIPGHAIVTLPLDRAERASSEVGFEIWLGADEKPGTGDERPGRLHAFCP